MPPLENHLKSHQLALCLEVPLFPLPPLLSHGLLGNLSTAEITSPKLLRGALNS